VSQTPKPSMVLAERVRSDAKAILADPRILVLDEATSQIDQLSEELVQDTLRGFLAGRTTILPSSNSFVPSVFIWNTLP